MGCIIDSSCHRDKKEKYKGTCKVAQVHPHACPRAMEGEGTKLCILAQTNPVLRERLERTKGHTTYPIPLPPVQQEPRIKMSYFDSSCLKNSSAFGKIRRQVGRMVSRYIAVLLRIARTPLHTALWENLLSLKRRAEEKIRKEGIAQGLVGWPKECLDQSLVPVWQKGGAMAFGPI